MNPEYDFHFQFIHSVTAISVYIRHTKYTDLCSHIQWNLYSFISHSMKTVLFTEFNFNWMIVPYELALKELKFDGATGTIYAQKKFSSYFFRFWMTLLRSPLSELSLSFRFYTWFTSHMHKLQFLIGFFHFICERDAWAWNLSVGFIEWIWN